jgi:hypothetical protein
MRLPAIPASLALLCTGCLSPSARAPDPRVVDTVLASAAEQVKRCYRYPKGGHSGRSIVTRLRVRFTPDGRLAGLPVVLGQSGVTASNRLYAARMAEAASLAVINCAPLRLPPEYHSRGWDQFDLTFSRSVAV